MSGPLPELVPLTRMVTARAIVMGAAASRDWQRQHHDTAYAHEMKLPDVIMNTPTQTAWFHGYAMTWAGPEARIARWRLKMRRPVCPGAEIVLSGAVARREPAGPEAEWIWLDLRFGQGGDTLSSMVLLLARPTPAGRSCWDIPAAEWTPPPLG